ncbi:phosphoglucosamine mutase [Vreelandella titanicae]|jgi:phosphoglucosamine mutase|uniref:Phosphoglucosamine mutase n=1 Tax=Vreelandella titanicae BH1 TaxID=1204738 RepID=L9U899_9GAMM|nr:phosphoglucosamine mutase [Halomonas titanicae]ELY20473.1 Phosphoglucosamine mutase [Halomonas titanicae BH1]|tara:strand:- start:2356 stop:3693 length:1338 start_codon:yes stop_codon:yes gene_type:complete
MRKYFGTDGVRGRVGEFPMTPDFAMKLGWAAGQVLGAEGVREVLIGKDTRASGYMLESALEAGFSAAGVNVALVGPLPTPGVAYLTSTFRADAGVVISASHNPFDDNGIKIFGQGGQKLNDIQEQEIERWLQVAIDGGMTCVSSEKLGKARRIDDAAGRYTEYCKANLPGHLSLNGLKIVVDSANGAGYRVGPAVFRELGAELISIHDKPNGLNINENCGATSMQSLCDAVLAHQADMGIALDGDADRLMMVDHTGAVVDGDELLYLLAKDAKRAGYTGGVVGTQMSNLGLEQALNGLNIPFKRAKVGDRYVLEQLNAMGWRLGGEGSGHLLSLDHASTGDAIIASLRVLASLLEQQATLYDAKQGMHKLPQTLINVRYTAQAGHDPLDTPAVLQAVALVERQLGQAGRVLLRKSGTEPLIRVMVEAVDADRAQGSAQQIADAFS